MISSLLPALLGGGARPAVDASGTPASTEEDFVSALLRALGSVVLESDTSEGAPFGAVEATVRGSLVDANTEGAAELALKSEGSGEPELDEAPDPKPSIRLGTPAPELLREHASAVLPEADYRPAVQPTSQLELIPAVPGISGERGRRLDTPLSPLTDVTPSAGEGESTVTFVAAAVAPVPADVSMADRSWARLNPELSNKLENVIERMKSEFGHDVRVIEGYRSPARQSHLFQQGRSRPGPIVTWTLDSEHSSGRAVDVQVDGSFEVTAGYARLQQVAAEEGLATLGMRDPGHLQLATSPSVNTAAVRVGQEVPVPLQEAPQSLPAVARDAVARPAQVAAVAEVAEVARVAQIARVARPGQDQVTARVETPAPVDFGPKESTPGTPAPLVIPEPTPRQPVGATMTPTSFAQADSHKETDAAGPRRRERGDRSDVVESAVDPSSEASREARLAALDVLSRGTGGALGRVSPTSSTQVLDSMARVEQVLEARAMADSAAPGRVSIRLDGAPGSADQVRVGLLGRAVAADFDVADAETAAMIRARVSELHSALESRGLDLGTVGVTSSRAELPMDAMYLNRPDAATDLLRSLLGTSGGEAGRDGSGRGRWEHNRTHDDGTGSGRSRREPGKQE